jgi:hypothetical protein
MMKCNEGWVDMDDLVEVGDEEREGRGRRNVSRVRELGDWRRFSLLLTLSLFLNLSHSSRLFGYSR